MVLCLAPRLATAQVMVRSANRLDGVAISRITPRTQAELPLPLQDFVYSYELKVLLRTTATGTIDVNYFVWSPSTQENRSVLPTEHHAVKRHGSRSAPARVLGFYLRETSAPINIHSAKPGDRLVVRATLRDAHGHVVCVTESTNELKGQVVVRPAHTPASSDHLQVLPGTTPVPKTVLAPNSVTPFVFRLDYSARQRAVINVEIGDDQAQSAGRPWTVSVVEVPAGQGQVVIRRPLELGEVPQGLALFITVLLRTNPLGNATAVATIKPYPIRR